MTKLLRILTGMHAGAELRLGEGVYRVSADDDADIRISDWRGEDVQLAVDATGVVTARSMVREPELATPEGAGGVPDSPAGAQRAAAASGSVPETAPLPDPGTVFLIDFVPMQFGDTVLCVGPADVVWPTDLELLSTLLAKPEEEARSRTESSSRRKLVGIVLGCSMLGAIIVIGSVLITMAVSRAAPHDPANIAQRVNEELASAHMRELHARVQGSRVVVTGIVPTTDDDIAVRNLLARLAPNAVVRQYDVAQIDVRNLEESLDTPGLQVKYAGHGVFDIEGAVPNPRDIDTRLTRMRHDLSPNIKQLRVQVTQSEEHMPAPEAFSELMNADGVRYAQTPDGVKHIFVSPGDDDASAVQAESADGASAALAAASGAAASSPVAAAPGAAGTAGGAGASSVAATTSATPAPASGSVAAGAAGLPAASAAPLAPTAAAASFRASGAATHEAKPAQIPAPKPAYLPLPR
jgi:type III secretion protein D